LQGERGEGRKPVGLGGAEFSQLFVLHLHDLAGEIALAAIPEWIDRQHFHVDRLRVHGSEPLVDLDVGHGCDLSECAPVDEQGRNSDRGSAGVEQCAGFAELAMGVHVDRFDPVATDHDG
jgi:hypothetical protein